MIYAFPSCSSYWKKKTKDSVKGKNNYFHKGYNFLAFANWTIDNEHFTFHWIVHLENI